MSSKVRRIDYYPDEYVSGVGGKLSAAEQGVYWLVCSLIYSRGEPIDDDHIWLSRLFADTHWRTIRSTLSRLIEAGKIERIDGKLTVKRCAEELHKARKRTAEAAQNGRKGGRPPNENNDLAEPDGFSGEKLTNNYQPIDKKEVSEEETIKSPKPAKRRISYPAKFLEFWSLYPTDALMSKTAAGKAFSSLTEDDQDAAINSIPAFKAYCSSHLDYRPVHAVRYLTQGRFEGFNQAAKKVDNRVFVPLGSPIWEAIRRKRCVVTMMHKDHHGEKGWWFDKAEIAEAMEYQEQTAA